ncbi:cardiolipin synthase ClsB [Pseudorhodoferax sp. Leaf267]|uniref:cardiolipin synthase ClsB n=1 Tax=Pseudorhodoferax sp. Leaf267 TaxID=1736316 RepID=UPI0006F658F2|nr:cardiolipin synthase ClsB [Pseudorhodoferax sp. Leaf267]KQP18122.1 cardiolipin synthase [Pseudorhodoferax sp. Leaf267]
MNNARWTAGNELELLENGEEFFPRVFEAIAQAEQEVVVETFILFEDKVGLALNEALLTAAKRGVQIDLTIDGFGSPDLSEEYIGALCRAGVRVHVFDPGLRIFKWRTNMLRRMHRKIVVVDAKLAFVGGINYSADHLLDFGPQGKQDYAVQIRGPVVGDIHRFVHGALADGLRHQQGKRWFRHRPLMRKRAKALPPAGDAQCMLVTRDNTRHTNDIERYYRLAIRSAREHVTIANAYFFPGYRLIRELRRAAQRGVEVRLILQGEPDMPIVKIAAQMLYHHLVRAGVKVYEYCERPLHGKVALVDDRWATVGSSNLDPLSLALNLEANVLIHDRAFNQTLRAKMDHLVDHACKQIDRESIGEPTRLQLLRSYFVFHLLRRYPAWLGGLPRHVPQLVPAGAGADTLTPMCPTPPQGAAQ